MATNSTSSFLSLILILISQVTAQDICGSIGNRNETRVTERRDRMFYLNTANQASCNGNIISFRVCYYGPTNISLLNGLRSFRATYSVYRMMGSVGSQRYVRVSEVFTAVRATRLLISDTNADGVIQSGFNCYTDVLDTSLQLSLRVEAGDVVGGCVFDPVDQPARNRHQLDVVGEVRGESLQAMDTSGCSLTGMPSTIPINTLTTVDSRRLHIYANIESIGLQVNNTAVMSESTTVARQGVLDIPSSNFIAVNPTSVMVRSHLTSVHLIPTPSSEHNLTVNTGFDTRSNMLVISVGASVGALGLLVTAVLIVSMAICFYVKKSKKRVYTVTTNAAYTRRITAQLSEDDADIVISDNYAYNASNDLGSSGRNVTYQRFQEPERDTQMQQKNGRKSDTNSSFKSRIVIKLSFINNSRRGHRCCDQNTDYDYVK